MSNDGTLDLPPETLRLLGASFNVQDHNWVQQGHEIICNGNCSFNHRHGHGVGVDMILTGSKGSWKLITIDEERAMRTRDNQ